MDLVQLPSLNYSYDALEPQIDARTMEIHHTKHHGGYVKKANLVLKKYPDVLKQFDSAEALMQNLMQLDLPESDRVALRNNLGGHLNHSLFWQLMDPSLSPDQDLTSEIRARFGSLDQFRTKFTQVAASHFGSGWAWLVRDNSGKLDIYSTPNQDSPYLKGDQPLIGLDVWEHAYYLHYQNRRPEYIDSWWQVLRLIRVN